MITNNYQLQNNIPHGAVKDVLPENINERLPENIQNYDAKDSFENNGAVKTVTNKDMDPMTLGLTGAIWLFLAQMGQKLNNSLANDWDKSWLGKVGNFFDKFGTKPKAGKKTLGQRIGALTDKFAITRALKTPTKPQNSMAISQSRGITGYVMSDVSSILETHLKNGHGDDILDVVKNIDAAKGLKNGDEALAYIKTIFDAPEKNTKEIKKLIENLSKKDIKISFDKLFKIPFTKKSIPNIPGLKRKASFKEAANKLNACFGGDVLGKQATKLGKGAPKQILKAYEGLTNAGAGGKLMIVIQATVFAQAIKKAIDAPKGEKWATFSENMANDFGYFLSLPLQVQASHKLGGLKYIGIGGAKNGLEQVKNVEKYRSMVKTLNDSVANGTISRIDYTKQVKDIKKFLNGNSKWWQKPFKAIGRIFSYGLDAETIKPFMETGKKSVGTNVMNRLKKLGSGLKGKSGGALRLVVGMLVVGPLIGKGITKISHAIFGRPTKSILDEEPSETDEKTAAQGQEQAQPDAQIATDPNEGLINYKYMRNAQNPYGATPNAQYTPSLNTIPTQDESLTKQDLFGLGKKKGQENIANENEPERRYIPSSKPVVLVEGNGELDASIAAALARAEAIEQSALENL